jgi:hypothetical protein
MTLLTLFSPSAFLRRRRFRQLEIRLAFIDYADADFPFQLMFSADSRHGCFAASVYHFFRCLALPATCHAADVFAAFAVFVIDIIR